MGMKIAFIGNQGGECVLDFYRAMEQAVRAERGGIESIYSTWLESEALAVRDSAKQVLEVFSFESWFEKNDRGGHSDIERLLREYPEVNWSQVIASERSFTDYSFLLGGAGDRKVTTAYVYRLLTNLVGYYEQVLGTHRPDAIVCQTADTLFTHVMYKVARHLGLRLYAISPAWLQEKGTTGGFFANDEFLLSEKMVAEYQILQGRELTGEEEKRIDAFIGDIVQFDGNKAYYATTKKNFGRSPVSPNLNRLLGYLLENSKCDENVLYTKFDFTEKVKANLKRFWRNRISRCMLGDSYVNIPEKSVFYALQFQPEQSTLVGGIDYSNQIALIESITKSLPLGYTLVLKEHPAGRGARPVWQYRHLQRMYNVIFCDAPSKEIIRQSQAVITITGTIAVESMAMDKPVIVLGRSFYNYAEVLYQVDNVKDLYPVLRKILVGGDYVNIPDRIIKIKRFLLSYLKALVPVYPTLDNAAHFGRELLAECDKQLLEKKGG
jgi:hypothetical protein